MSIRDWVHAYAGIVDALPERAQIPCPHCGHADLRIQFVGDVQTRAGYAVVWCANCNYGLHFSRVQVPEVATMLAFDVTADVLAKAIPTYHQVT
jgi:transcription elongation factor Elf1